MREKKIRAFIATVFLFAVVLAVGDWIRMECASGINWEEKVKTTIVRREGHSETIKGIKFPVVNRGDEVCLEIALPKEEEVEEGTLCFIVYNSVTDAFYKDELIYSEGRQLCDQNLMIGQSFIQILIPQEAWGKNISVRIHPCEEHAFAGIGDMRMYPGRDAYLYISGDKIVEFVSSMIGMCGGVMIIILLFTFGSRRERKGMFAASGIFMLALWEFTICGQYHIFSRNYFWVLAEYMALLFFPAFILSHIYVSVQKGKKLCRIVMGASWIWCICSVILHFTNGWRFSESVSVTHTWILIACLVGILTAIWNRKTAMESEKMRNMAVLLLCLWEMVDLTSFYLGQKFGKRFCIRVATFSSIGLLMFMACMVVYLVLVTQEVLEEKMRKEIEDQKNIEYLQKCQVYDRLRLSINQLHPHFLYNVLCSIQVIIKQNAEYAYELMYDFMIYLRGNIDMLQSEALIPFEREVENIDAYMNIEKMRYPGRELSLQYDIQCKNFKVAPLSIEMLVENAAKYGKFPDGAGEIRVTAVEGERDYIIEVIDNGGGFDLVRLEEEGHTGIKNVKLRMEILLKAQVDIESTVGVGTRFVIRIPK